jgi:hypothetical protein
MYVSFLIASPDLVQGATPEFGGYSFVAGLRIVTLMTSVDS